MGAQLILGAQQILMVLGAQGAQTMNCTKAVTVTRYLLVCHPAIIAQLKFLEHLAIRLNLVLFTQDVSRTK